MAFDLKHQTPAEFAKRLRERYRSASKEDAGKIAAWVIRKIAAGDITDLQVRTAFGLTVTQYNAMKTRMTAMSNNYNTLQAAKGE